MMQALTGGPRAGMTAADVEALLHADDTKVTDFGADLLGLDDEVLADVSPDLRSAVMGGGQAPVVSWDGTVDIHRQVVLTIARDLAWDRDRLRLWIELTSDVLGLSAVFYAGVFVMISPTTVADDTYLVEPTPGGDTVEHACTGLDKLHLLQSPIPDTWTAVTDGSQVDPSTGSPSVSVAGELRRLLAAAEYRGLVVIDPALESLTLSEAKVWPADGTTTWLKAANELLSEVAGDSLWVDEVGTTHARMLVQVADRPTEYTLDAQSPRTIIGPKRTRTRDLSTVANAWRFTASNWPNTPVEGDGQYTPAENTGDGSTSVTARGRHVWSLVTVDVDSQDALVAAAEAQRAKDLRAAGVRSLTVSPLPILGHDDVLSLPDTALGDPVTALVTKWDLHFDGSDGDLEVEEIT